MRYTRVVALPKPSDRERTQWYFQRYVAHLPAAGEIVIFNRSWYNRAGVEVVMGFSTEAEQAEFLRDAPDFERMLVESGIRLVKLWLDIDKDEQAARFRDRIQDKTKNWKFSPADLKEREYWDQYMAAYQDMLRKCSKKEAPWYVIPANRKWFRNLAVSQILRDELEDMNLKFPKPVADLSGIKFE